MSNRFEINSGSGTDTLDAMLKNWTDKWPESSGSSNAEWILCEDGYFYYTKVLKAGTSTNMILNTINLHDDAPISYSTCKYTLDFKVDAVIFHQKLEEETGQFWGMTPQYISNDEIRWK